MVSPSTTWGWLSRASYLTGDTTTGRAVVVDPSGMSTSARRLY
jgi:hypothetical protein